MTNALTVIPPSHSLNGQVVLPGSKSITNRVLLLAALATGRSVLSGALKSDDTRYMAQALTHLGAVIEQPDATTFVVENRHGLHAAKEPLYLGNAGTAMRFLTALAGTIEGRTKLTGDSYMHRRPIGPLVEALQQVGVDITDTNGCPPVTVQGQKNWTGSLTVDPTLSSQYVSALLMAGACGHKPLDVILAAKHFGAQGYVSLTIDAMRGFGAHVERTATGFLVQPSQYVARDFAVEADASAATYFWAAAKITDGAIDLDIDPNHSAQPDAASYEAIAQYPKMPAQIDGLQMQDAIPTLAVLAALGEHSVRFVNVGGLRVKECDRIIAICGGLNRVCPGTCDEGADFFTVHPLSGASMRTASRREAARPTVIETYDDHRIAMAFALLGLKLPGIGISHPQCVAKTFPGYWDALGALGVQFTND